MPDKPHPATDHPFQLSGQSLLALTGRDACAFAQAQFMNDVAALAPNQWQWNGWLTAKGRVMALFALLKWDAETLWLVLPDVPAADLATQLRRYVFRSKLSLTPRDDLFIGGRFAPPVHAHGNTTSQTDDAAELDWSGAGGARTLRITSTPMVADAAYSAQWQQADLVHGLPRLPASQAEQWTPQQLSLERLQAFSVKKGCYPGQEIVARTHFLGQAKRGLARLHAASALAVGAEIHSDGRSVGNVISAAGGAALAVLPTVRPTTPLSCSGLVVHEHALLAGLAR